MTADNLVEKITEVIINPLLLLLFAAGFLYFLWGMTMFIWKADSDEGRTTGTRHMIWGIVGMFIMVAVMGIIKVIKGTFGI